MGLKNKQGILLGKRSANNKSAIGKKGGLNNWIQDGGEYNYLRFTDPLSVLILAPSGTGKTSGLVIPNLYFLKHSIICHDPKGEMFETTNKWRSNFSKVVAFDPVKSKTARFNPLSRKLLPQENGAIDFGKLRGYIENVGTTIIPKDTNSKGAFFNDTARQVFIFVAEWLCWKEGDSSLPTVYKMITSNKDFLTALEFMRIGIDPRNMKSDATVKDVLELIKDDPNLATLESSPYRKTGINGDLMPEDFINDLNSITVSSGGSEQWAGVLGTLNQHMNIFADKTIAENTSGETQLIPEDFRKESITLYVVVRDEDRDRLKGLVTLLFEVFANTLLSTMPKDDDYRVTLLLDEFTRLGKLKVIKTLPEISRGYNVNAMFLAQDYAQIESVYDLATTKIFDTNTAYKVIFRQNNYDTAERVSKTIGNKTEERVSESKQSGKSKGSKSTSQEGLRLFTAQDIMNLPKENTLILSQGFLAKPVLARTAYFFEDKKMMNDLKRGYPKGKKPLPPPIKPEPKLLPHVIKLSEGYIEPDPPLANETEPKKAEAEAKPEKTELQNAVEAEAQKEPEADLPEEDEKVLSEGEANALGVNFKHYKKRILAGKYKVSIDYRVWSDPVGIQLLCCNKDNGKKFSIIVFKQEKTNNKSKYKNFYGAKDYKIDFGSEDIEKNTIFIFKVDKKDTGNNSLLEARKMEQKP